MDLPTASQPDELIAPVPNRTPTTGNYQPRKYVIKTKHFLSATIAAAGFLLNVSDARASIISYHLDLTVSETGDSDTGFLRPEDVSVGDVFFADFALDDSKVDSSPNIPNRAIGRFAGAVLTLRVSRSPSNTGTWQPFAGTWSLPAASLTSTITVGSVTKTVFTPVSAAGSGFPGVAWSGGTAEPGTSTEANLSISLSGILINDTGVGQTLLEQIGPGPYTPSGSTGTFTFSDVGPFVFMTGSDFGEGLHTSIPEPATAGLLLAGVGMLGVRRRRV